MFFCGRLSCEKDYLSTVPSESAGIRSGSMVLIPSKLPPAERCCDERERGPLPPPVRRLKLND
jgi:hypothetical protein